MIKIISILKKLLLVLILTSAILLLLINENILTIPYWLPLFHFIFMGIFVAYPILLFIEVTVSFVLRINKPPTQQNNLTTKKSSRSTLLSLGVASLLLGVLSALLGRFGGIDCYSCVNHTLLDTMLIIGIALIAFSIFAIPIGIMRFISDYIKKNK